MNGTFEAAIQSRTLNLDLKDAGIGNESLSTICTDLFLITMNMTPDLDMGSEEDLRRILRYYVEWVSQPFADMIPQLNSRSINSRLEASSRVSTTDVNSSSSAAVSSSAKAYS